MGIMKLIQQNKIIVFSLVILFPSMGILPAQQEQGEPSLLFRSDETIELTLTMGVRTVLRDVGDDREQHPALISYLSSNGEIVELPLKIRTRGHFRKDPMNCDFPPLRLNFASKTSGNTIFEGQDKLKLVTHCRTRGSKYEQNVLKEYLVYRLYNLFTDESYQVRLVEFTYVDSLGKVDTLNRMGFFIEPSQQMTERNNCEGVLIKNVQQDQCERYKTNVMSVFQYMVGNTDWSIPAGHNVVLIREEITDPPITVPFDFDWCGLVNSPYALPNPVLGIDNVRTRLFRGFCRSENEFEMAFQEFREREEDIFKTIDSVPGLSDRERQNVVKYMEQFFKVINNPKLSRNEFLNNCRTE
jgi:hypothetical protein